MYTNRIVIISSWVSVNAKSIGLPLASGSNPLAMNSPYITAVILFAVWIDPAASRPPVSWTRYPFIMPNSIVPMNAQEL